MESVLTDTKPYKLNPQDNYALNGGAAENPVALGGFQCYFVMGQLRGTNYFAATFWFHDGYLFAEAYEFTKAEKPGQSARIRNHQSHYREMVRERYTEAQIRVMEEGERQIELSGKELSDLIETAAAMLRENFFTKYNANLDASLEGLLASSFMPHPVLDFNIQN